MSKAITVPVVPDGHTTYSGRAGRYGAEIQGRHRKNFFWRPAGVRSMPDNFMMLQLPPGMGPLSRGFESIPGDDYRSYDLPTLGHGRDPNSA